MFTTRRLPRPSLNGSTPLRLARPAAARRPTHHALQGGSLERRVSLVLGGAIAGWGLLALAFVGRLNLAPTTIAAAAFILALLAGTLVYAIRLGARADFALATAGSGRATMRRGLDHLHFVAALCQLLGLIGTVAGFLIVLTGGFANVNTADQASVQHLLSRVAEGSATALVSTFTGVVASVLISLVAHMLAPAAE
jgi:MotA/TolQ/ExbB proton channel family